MSLSRSVTFTTYCIMNLLLGMHFFNVYPDVTILVDMFLENEQMKGIKDYFVFVYPFLYIILGPFCFKFIWKSFYWSNCVSWVCVLSGIWLKFFSLDSNIAKIAGHVLMVGSTSLALPGIGVLAVKYFEFQDYFFALSWSSFAHIAGLILGAIFRDLGNQDLVFLSQGLLGLLAATAFAILSEEDPVIGKSEDISFYSSLKILFNNKDEGLVLLMICCQIAYTYIYCAGIRKYLEKGLNIDVRSTDLIMIVFLICSVLGIFISRILFNWVEAFGVLVRSYLGISFLVLFLLKIVFRVYIFNVGIVVWVGFVVIPTLPLLLIIGLSIHRMTLQPISVNIVYYFAFLIMCVFIIISSLLKQWIRIEITNLIIQSLILLIFLTVYDIKTEARFLKMKKKNNS